MMQYQMKSLVKSLPNIWGNEKIKGSIKDAQVYFPTEITLKKK
jgi:hypothetical protein